MFPRSSWRLLPLVICATVLSAQDWYVATNGNDGAAGSSAAPFATIGKGVGMAKAGDTVWIRGGTYQPNGLIEIKASGTASAPITIRSVAGQTVVIDGRKSVPGWDWDGVITSWNRSHLIIDGLRIINSRWSGIALNGGTGLIVRNCSTENTNASGIYIRDANQVKVLSNTIRKACQLPYFNPNKGTQECITFANVADFEIAYNTVHDRMVDVSWGGEGIDCKGNCRNGSVHHNLVYDLIRLGIYVEAYGNTVDNIAVYANTVRNCRHGIVVGNEVNSGVTKNVRVHDNVVSDCPARGISIAGYDGNGPVQHVSIYNNTITRCGSIGGWEGAGIVIEANNGANTGFVVRNNIIANNGTQISTRGQSFLSIERNLVWGSGTLRGNNAINADPRFVNAGANDFRLAANSPAIDAATGTPVSVRDRDDRARPIDGDGNGSAIADLGAYERAAGTSAPPPPAPAPLPSGWSTQDVGSVAATGSATHTDGSWTVQGSGADIWETSDHFRFVYRQWTGDVRITARVTGLTNTNAWAKVGVMVREGLTTGARHAMSVVTATQGASFQRRTTAGALSAQTLVAGVSAPRWVRVERRGNVLTGFTSADGQTWQKIEEVTIALAAATQVGLAVTSHQDGTLCTATFTDVEVVAPPALPTPPADGIPDGWTTQDVGNVAAAGSTSYANGTWTLAGSGTDIWNKADGFQFAWRPVTGDARITARVTGMTHTHNWAKAGVMVRESLAAGSRHASMFATSRNGVSFQRRTTTNGSSASTAGPAWSAPVWVRLERDGDVLISSTSTNGTSWQEVRRQTIAMGAAVYVGLAVTSHNNGVLCTATFTNVEVIAAPTASN